MFSWDENKRGRVVAITGTTARIRTTRGGEFTCHNDRFKVGDVVQYIPDISGRNLLAIRKKPETHGVDPVMEYLQSLEPDNNEEDFYEEDGDGQIDTWDSDWFSGSTGINDTESTSGTATDPESILFPLGIKD
jgi:hypothetical protein